MYSANAVGILIIGLGIWLAVLSYFFWREQSFLKRLVPKGEGQDLKEKLKEVLAEVEILRKENQTLNRNSRELSKEGLHHIQKVGMLRYNPYEDTGGDVSFSLVLLDGAANGLLLTSLHSRAGTRVYTKEIVGGKSQLQLSKEEQKVVDQATY